MDYLSMTIGKQKNIALIAHDQKKHVYGPFGKGIQQRALRRRPTDRSQDCGRKD